MSGKVGEDDVDGVDGVGRKESGGKLIMAQDSKVII